MLLLACLGELSPSNIFMPKSLPKSDMEPKLASSLGGTAVLALLLIVVARSRMKLFSGTSGM